MGTVGSGPAGGGECRWLGAAPFGAYETAQPCCDACFRRGVRSAGPLDWIDTSGSAGSPGRVGAGAARCGRINGGAPAPCPARPWGARAVGEGANRGNRTRPDSRRYAPRCGSSRTNPESRRAHRPARHARGIHGSRRQPNRSGIQSVLVGTRAESAQQGGVFAQSSRSVAWSGSGDGSCSGSRCFGRHPVLRPLRTAACGMGYYSGARTATDWRSARCRGSMVVGGLFRSHNQPVGKRVRARGCARGLWVGCPSISRLELGFRGRDRAVVSPTNSSRCRPPIAGPCPGPTLPQPGSSGGGGWDRPIGRVCAGIWVPREGGAKAIGRRGLGTIRSADRRQSSPSWLLQPRAERRAKRDQNRWTGAGRAYEVDSPRCPYRSHPSLVQGAPRSETRRETGSARCDRSPAEHATGREVRRGVRCAGGGRHRVHDPHAGRYAS